MTRLKEARDNLIGHSNRDALRNYEGGAQRMAVSVDELGKVAGQIQNILGDLATALGVSCTFAYDEKRREWKGAHNLLVFIGQALGPDS